MYDMRELKNIEMRVGRSSNSTEPGAEPWSIRLYDMQSMILLIQFEIDAEGLSNMFSDRAVIPTSVQFTTLADNVNKRRVIRTEKVPASELNAASTVIGYNDRRAAEERLALTWAQERTQPGERVSVSTNRGWQARYVSWIKEEPTDG